MKKLILITALAILFAGMAFSQPVNSQKIIITSSSCKAQLLYQDAMKAMENAEIAKVNQLLLEALMEDPDFFMGHFIFAYINLYFNNHEAFNKHAEEALNSKALLSFGEMLLGEALRRLYDDPKTDVTDVGKKLAELYPRDEMAFYMQAFFQAIVNDYEGSAETYARLLQIAENKAPVYNMMGYNYLQLNDFAAAEQAFDKYIELFPGHPNPYDSKGDFFMQVKDYPNAYSSYITANRINESWSYDKAMNAKELMEKTLVTGKSEDVEKTFKEGLELRLLVIENFNKELNDKSKMLFKKALETDPTYVPALIHLSWTHLSRETKKFWEQNYLDSALYFAQRAWYFDKESAKVHVLLAHIYQNKGMYDEAMSKFKMALSCDTNNSSDVHRSLGVLLFQMGDYYNGLNCLLNQLESEKESEANYHTLTNLFYQLGRIGFHKECNEFNERILQLRHDSVLYCNNKMFSCFLEGNFEAGVELARQSLKTNPASSNCKYYLGWATLFQRKFEESYHWFSQIEEEIKSGNRITNTAGIGYACLLNGMKEEADFHFSEAILTSNRMIEANYFPETFLPHLVMASVYSAKGENKKALDHLRQNKSCHIQALLFLKYDPMLDNLRNETEFQKILKETETKYNGVHQRVGKLLAERGIL